MDCSTPGFPVHDQLLEFAQTHVHWVSDAIQASHPLFSASSPAFNLSQHQGLSQWVSSSHHVAKVLEFQCQCLVVVIMVIAIIVVCSVCCIFLLCYHAKCFMCTSSTNPYTNFITTIKYHNTNGGRNLGKKSIKYPPKIVQAIFVLRQNHSAHEEQGCGWMFPHNQQIFKEQNLFWNNFPSREPFTITLKRPTCFLITPIIL